MSEAFTFANALGHSVGERMATLGSLYERFEQLAAEIGETETGDGGRETKICRPL
jgi:hypothetical protein